MGLKNLYLNIYEQFIEKYSTAKGYDFHQGSPRSVPPKSLFFKGKLKWWTLDRPNRLKRITGERDRQQEEILALKNNSKSHTESSSQ